MNRHEPASVHGRFFTPGTNLLLAMMAIGFSFGLARFLTGLAAVTNLTDAYPWGLWIAIDVACGVALAAGGFTTAALVEIFGERRYHALLRPAILTAWLGYIMVGVGLTFDLGRYWNAWQPVFNWQGNSVLFEVGMCVLTYLVVLTVEMSAAFLDGFRDRVRTGGWGAQLLRRIPTPLYHARRIVRTVLPFFVIAGVVLSCMHQSSLGALMVIAPTKMSPLWYTPLLPLLFLLSAIMVGFPMVILESIVASRSLGREVEIDVLGPLARLIPWTIGAYALVRLVDLIVRWNQVDLFQSAGQTIAFLAETVFGLVLPFVLLLQKPVRRSAGWLLFASLLVIGGVVLNRVNVFLVAYEPPFQGRGYFPAIGEIALTLGLVCTIMFCYRAFVFLFPILSGSDSTQNGLAPTLASPEGLSREWTWAFRGLAVALILGFSLVYAFVHREAVSGEMSATNWGKSMEPVLEETPALSPAEHAGRPEGYRRVYTLNNRLLNTTSNFYEPVRFTHISHDESVGGNCGICHHRFSVDEADRVGLDLAEFHREFDVNLGGPCSACHDMETITIQRCDGCHWLPDEPDHPSRVGLKGAYHRQCIGCHESSPSAAAAPTDCIGCHHPLTPDHTTLVNASPSMQAGELVSQCAGCHERSAEEILVTAHWNWIGHSPDVCGAGEGHDLRAGIPVNNYLIATPSNREYCGTCHIGLGCLLDNGPFEARSAVDCLVCHDTTGTYKKELGGGGAADRSVDLVTVARAVGRPSRFNCGSCHFYSDGGPNAKHGDLERILTDPPDDFDVHMGRYDMRCQDCHTTREHRVAGMSLSAPAVEGRVRCARCHGETPHGISGATSRHLDDHTRSVSCEVCHIPSIAKELPTQVLVDYARAGEYGPVPADAMGRPTYPEDAGVEVWQKDLIPTYAWYDGTREVHSLGDKIGSARPFVLNQPLGERRNPASKIHAFKVHRAVQPYDTERNVLVAPKLWGGFWRNFDWSEAITEGMSAAGLEYSGSFSFVETAQYTGIHHEVVPSGRALGCTDCHATEAVTCTRCHSGASAAEVERFLAPVYPGSPRRLDLKALGYDGDPARVGGRFYFHLGRGRPLN